MAVTLNTPTAVGEGSWEYTWSSTVSSPTYYVYENGELVDVTVAESRIVRVDEGTSVTVEVLDNSATSPEYAQGGYLYLCWYPALDFDVNYYEVAEYVDASWTVRQRVVDDGRGFYKWQTRWLEDETTHTFRVRAFGDNDNYGDPQIMYWTMARIPDPPQVEYDYSNTTHKLTISAA